MGWIYFQELVGSGLPLNLGLERSPIVSVSDTHKVSYCPGCDQVTLIEPQFGTMSQPCAERCFQELTLSSEVFPVRTSALPGLEKAWKETEVAFSSRLSGLPESANLDLFSSKMSLPSEPVEGKEWLKNWPRSGMTVDGQLYQPQQLEPHTKGKDGFSWPTPTASDDRCSEMLEKWKKRAEEKKKQGINIQFPLRLAVQMWPTPPGERIQGLRSGWKQEPSPHEQEGLSLREGQRRIESDWSVEPDVGRVVNGLPDRAHRIRCLGNSVVPLQVREAFKKVMGIYE